MYEDEQSRAIDEIRENYAVRRFQIEQILKSRLRWKKSLKQKKQFFNACPKWHSCKSPYRFINKNEKFDSNVSWTKLLIDMGSRGLLVSAVFTFVAATVNVVDIGKSNENILAETEVVLVNFYADWCRFSRQLHPIFVNTANVIREGEF